MSIDTKNKMKIVIEEWKNAIPQLTQYSNNKLYKIVGALVVGIELIKLPRTEEYRPHFVIYPLWKKDLKSCFEVPILMMEYYNRKGLQYSIQFEKHSLYFEEVLESVIHQTPIDFEGDIALKKLFHIIDDYSKTSQLRTAPNSYLQALLQEKKLELALIYSYGDSTSIYNEIKRREWDLNSFKLWNIDINKWLLNLEEKSRHSKSLLNQMEVNINDTKLKKIKFSKIIE